MKFELVNQLAVVAKVDPKRGKTDDAYVSVAIKLNVSEMPTDAAAGAMCADDAASVRAAFFRPLSVDADENKTFLNVSSLVLKQGFKNIHAIAFKGQRKVRVSSISSLTIDPLRAGKFDMTMTVTIEHPPTGFVEWICENLNRAVRITLEQDGEFDFSAKSEAAPVTTTEGAAGAPAKIEAKADKKAGKPGGRKSTASIAPKPAKKAAAKKTSSKKRPPRKRAPKKTSEGASVH